MMADQEQFQTLLAFEIAETHCAVQSEFVREVQRAVSLSSVPEAGPHVLGAMNLRGQMVFVLDLRVAIGAPAKAVGPTDHFVVLWCGDRLLAIRVDQARALLRVEEGAMTDSAAVLPMSHFVTRIARVGEQFIHIIDPARLSALANVAE